MTDKKDPTVKDRVTNQERPANKPGAPVPSSSDLNSEDVGNILSLIAVTKITFEQAQLAVQIQMKLEILRNRLVAAEDAARKLPVAQ